MIKLQKKTQKNIIQIGHEFFINHRTLISGGSTSRKTNALLNLIKQQNDYDHSTIEKFTDILRIQMKQNINVLLKNIRIQRLLLNIKIICRMSTKILMSTNQIENIKY